MQEHKRQSEITFNFGLCVVPLQVILVTYFRPRNRNLKGGNPLEDGEICYH